MKICPMCKRTYPDDTLAFCLVDGSVLSPTYEPHQTERIPPPRSTDPPAQTDVLYPPTRAASAPPMTTIVSPPPRFPLNQPQVQKQRASRGLGTWIAAFLLITSAVLGTVAFFMYRTNHSEKDHSASKVGNSSPVSNSTSGDRSSCLAEDPGAGVKDREAHVGWAQQRDRATLTGNLNYKADLLFRCPAMTDDLLASAFADISVAIAKAVPNASCFGGDSGVVGTDWSAHKNAFSDSPNRRERLLTNLKWKMSAALNCLDRTRQTGFFADVSVLIANAPKAQQ